MDLLDRPRQRTGVLWKGSSRVPNDAARSGEPMHVRLLVPDAEGNGAAGPVSVSWAGRRWRLNEYAGPIWVLCDGTHTVQDIASEIREWPLALWASGEYTCGWWLA